MKLFYFFLGLILFINFLHTFTKNQKTQKNGIVLNVYYTVQLFSNLVTRLSEDGRSTSKLND